MARHDVFIDHLQQVSLFAACSRKDLQLVAKRAEEIRVGPGKALITEGETGHEYFVILSGTAKVLRHGPVVAETDMELIVLGQREFAGIVDEVPGFARKMLAGMAKRLREADARSVQ
jgi:CRP-like cAMP-binding protein